MTLDGFVVAKSLASAQRSQWWTAKKIRDSQEQALSQSLRHALSSVPYYRSLGLSLDATSPAESLARFPVLTKAVVQKEQHRMLADGFSFADCQLSTTSGSTGEPTTTAFDRKSWLLCKYALKVRRLLAHGIGIGKRVLIVSEMHPDEIAGDPKMFGRGILFGQKTVSIHSPISEAVRAMREFRPHAIYAFPSFMAELLDYLQQQELALPKTKIVFTSSEMLSEVLRARITETMNTEVCDVYGSTEFKEVAWQCHRGRYHINFESTWVETVDVSGDGFGIVLLTTLVNRAMPLIRYRVGDRVRLGEGLCGCGRQGPWLAAVGGREVDMMVLRNGQKLSPYLLTTAVENDSAIRRYLLRQTTPTSLQIRYIAAPNCVANEKAIAMSIERVVGNDVSISFQRVPSLPRTVRGKQKVFVRDFEPTAPGSS